MTFIADVRTAKIADLVVIKDGSEADGSTANTLRARVTDAFGNALAGQAVSVMAGNSATVTPTVTTQSGRYGGDLSVTSQTAGTSTVTASINSSSLSRERDVYCGCQDGADRGAGSDAGLRRGRWFDGEHAAGEGDRCVR